MTRRMSVFCCLEVASAMVEVIGIKQLNNIEKLIKKASAIVEKRLTSEQKARCFKKILDADYPDMTNGFIALSIALELLSFATNELKDSQYYKDKEALRLVNLSRGRIANYLIEVDEEKYNDGITYADRLLRGFI